MSVWRVSCVICLGVLVALVAGCGDDNNCVKPDPTMDPPLLPSCLEKLMTAYTDRNVEEYVKLFAEDFTFVFSPDDIAEDPTIPEQWGLAEEGQAHENMFNSDVIDRIELQFTQSVADSSGHEHPGTWRVLLSEIELRVHTQNQEGGYLLLMVTGGFGSFYFKEYPDETASDGQPLWKIWRWEDQPLGLKGLGRQRDTLVEENSWGQIKNLFR